MRREILTEFPSRIIDFENKNISIVQKQWKFRISVPMSYIALGHYSKIVGMRYGIKYDALRETPAGIKMRYIRETPAGIN